MTSRIGLALVTLTLATAGCRVAPTAADPSIRTRSVNAPLLRAPTVRIHVATVGDESLPEVALEASMATLRRHLPQPIEVIRHPAVPGPPAESPEIEFAPEFPVFRDGKQITREDLTGSELESGTALTCRLDTPDRGILGVAGLPSATDADGRVVGYGLRPIVEPDVLLVMVVPGSGNGLGHTGYATQVVESDSLHLRTGLVILRRSAIRRRAGVFVPESRLWEWTLTHEIGHVLGVPASNQHACIVPGYGGIHCTHPECVMATGVSWRTIASGLINGWPLDYCEACSAEIRAGRGTEQVRDSGGEAEARLESEGMGTR